MQIPVVDQFYKVLPGSGLMPDFKAGPGAKTGFGLWVSSLRRGGQEQAPSQC